MIRDEDKLTVKPKEKKKGKQIERNKECWWWLVDIVDNQIFFSGERKLKDVFTSCVFFPIVTSWFCLTAS